jgi:hypothetical protein
LAKILARVEARGIAMGVVTGIPREFQFGTNRARFSKATGGVIGQTLTLAAMGMSVSDAVRAGPRGRGEGSTLRCEGSQATTVNAMRAGDKVQGTRQKSANALFKDLGIYSLGEAGPEARQGPGEVARGTSSEREPTRIYSEGVWHAALRFPRDGRTVVVGKQAGIGWTTERY